MLNRIFGMLCALLGMKPPSPRPATTRMVDPKQIRATIPTLCEDLPPLEPIGEDDTGTDLRFHEDEWRQIEFLPRAALPEIERMLGEYRVFELDHRTEHGWNGIYVRKLTRMAVAPMPDPARGLAGILGVEAGAAPVLFAYAAGSSRVVGGFTFAIGGDCHLYGCADAHAFTCLGACVGKDADRDQLVEACVKLQAVLDVVLVDWRSQTVILGVTADRRLEVWQPQAGDAG